MFDIFNMAHAIAGRNGFYHRESTGFFEIHCKIFDQLKQRKGPF